MTSRKIMAFGGRHTIAYGRRQFEFELFFSDRKNLTINVHPDLRVVVKAPPGREVSQILLRVQKRANWIVKQLDYFHRFQPLPTKRQYVSGETYVYLGRQYLLKIVTGQKEEVKLIGRHLCVFVQQRTNRVRVRQLVQDWYRDHALVILDKRLRICVEAVKRMGIALSVVRYRELTSRWGSCSKSGRVTLNTELVKAPTYCIDYVVMHEMCHLKHRDHSPAFWRLLATLMPDWEKRKIKLEEVII